MEAAGIVLAEDACSDGGSALSRLRVRRSRGVSLVCDGVATLGSKRRRSSGSTSPRSLGPDGTSAGVNEPPDAGPTASAAVKMKSPISRGAMTPFPGRNRSHRRRPHRLEDLVPREGDLPASEVAPGRRQRRGRSALLDHQAPLTRSPRGLTLGTCLDQSGDADRATATASIREWTPRARKRRRIWFLTVAMLTWSSAAICFVERPCSKRRRTST